MCVHRTVPAKADQTLQPGALARIEGQAGVFVAKDSRVLATLIIDSHSLRWVGHEIHCWAFVVRVFSGGLQLCAKLARVSITGRSSAKLCSCCYENFAADRCVSDGNIWASNLYNDFRACYFDAISLSSNACHDGSTGCPPPAAFSGWKSIRVRWSRLRPTAQSEIRTTGNTVKHGPGKCRY